MLTKKALAKILPYVVTPARMFLIAHPVGSLYWSSNSTDPGTLFGGTWTQIKDKFVLAAGDTYIAGDTGGEKEVTLTAAQSGNPAHTHAASVSGRAYVNIDSTASIDEDGSGSLSGSGNYIPYTTSNWNWTVAQATGSNTDANASQSHNNMPPYITKYCWERTA